MEQTMTLEEAKRKCEQAGQQHLLAYYDELTKENQENLLAQIERMDLTLLDLLKKDTTEVEKGKLEPLGAVTLEEIQKEKDEYRKMGCEAIRAGKVGAVLLAGGQGTRLGLDKPKGMLNVGVHKELYLFEQLIHNIMDVVRETGVWVPLFIMTSEKNNKDTVEFFKEKKFFGYNEEYVFFFVQQMAPSVSYDGKIYMEEKGRISASPNGNGGWFISMVRAGLLDTVKKLGVEWLNVFSVDNVLQRIADPVFLGATIDSGKMSGAKVVRKACPEEKVGVMCKEDGKPHIIEYYEMTDDMLNKRLPDGSLAYGFGAILNYLFPIQKLKETLDKSMPLHIVKKKVPYVDESGNPVTPAEPNAFKFETLALDLIHEMDDCLIFEVDREHEFAPVKNSTGVDSVDTARALLEKNGYTL